MLRIRRFPVILFFLAGVALFGEAVFEGVEGDAVVDGEKFGVDVGFDGGDFPFFGGGGFVDAEHDRNECLRSGDFSVGRLGG